MSRKIYFCGSITAGRDDADIYARLIKQLQEYGKVLTEHVGYSDPEKDEKGLTEKAESDCVIAEVTQPSLGVGYEINQAIHLKRPILCLFRPDSGKRLSALIQGADNRDSFIVKHYKESDAPSIFREFLKEE